MVVVLIAYLDESYNQIAAKKSGDPLVYTVAAYLSTREKW